MNEKNARILGMAVLLFSILAFTVTSAGITRTGISGGRISAFGSIFVNDRELETNNAVVLIDGQVRTIGDLKLGQRVLVKGIIDSELPTGIATEVLASSAAAGSITAIDVEEEQLTVLGNVVLADADTVIELMSNSSKFSDLTVGSRVRISGAQTSNGDILATRIEELAVDTDNLLAGKIANLVNSFFEMNEVNVDASAAQIIGFPGGVLTVGTNVRVRSSSFGLNGELIASSVESIPDIKGSEFEVGELEGLVGNFSSAAAFSVDSVTVTSGSLTAFAGGGPANLATDVNIVVRGEFDSSGTLAAKEIEIRGTRIRISGRLSNATEQSLAVLGIPIEPTQGARMEDKSSADVEPFTVADLSVGDYVNVRGDRNPPAVPPVVIERLERTDADEQVEARGFVSHINGQFIQVLGAAVYVDNDTRYRDAAGKKISATEFFDRVTVGTYVKMKGVESSVANLLATEISLRLDN